MTNKKKTVQIIISQKNSYIFDQLNELNASDLLNSPSRCRNYLLKGLQRFLYFCAYNHLNIDSALIELSILGKDLSNDLPITYQSCRELYNSIINQDFPIKKIESEYIENNELEDKQPKIKKREVNEECANSTINVEQNSDGEQDSNDSFDWSIYASSVGLVNE